MNDLHEDLQAGAALLQFVDASDPKKCLQPVSIENMNVLKRAASMKMSAGNSVEVAEIASNTVDRCTVESISNS